MPRSFLVKKVKYPVANHHAGGPRWYRQPSSPTEAAPVPSPQPSSPSRAVALPAYGESCRWCARRGAKATAPQVHGPALGRVSAPNYAPLDRRPRCS
ncbi:hypothetical protein HPB51_023882 [Rhipicephalus microplus]|uniref:Uncharacterized protein n=1 Tax=Rhipicephalus microplus TaxID=6941 RepID=A0A9J6DD27_RHIMP|nr:hypothetical protein HPB51_023882 [Rhipicephalus microplus]